MNLFPEKLKKLMLPCQIETEEIVDNTITPNINLANNNVLIGSTNEEILSGSTCYENKKVLEKVNDLKIDDTSKIIYLILNVVLLFFVFYIFNIPKDIINIYF